MRSTCNGEVLFGWVPVSAAEVYNCCIDGFADRPYPDGSHKDFGDGHPVMLEASWACVNASEWPKAMSPNKKGEFCVLLCLVGIGRDAKTAVPPNLSEHHLLLVKDGMQLLPL